MIELDSKTIQAIKEFRAGGPRDCPDCAVKPGQSHQPGCDTERCSVCGCQVIGCPCDEAKHDPAFSRWTGYWPGSLEATVLGVDMNLFYARGYHTVFLVKPAEAS